MKCQSPPPMNALQPHEPVGWPPVSSALISLCTCTSACWLAALKSRRLRAVPLALNVAAPVLLHEPAVWVAVPVNVTSETVTPCVIACCACAASVSACESLAVCAATNLAGNNENANDAETITVRWNRIRGLLDVPHRSELGRKR